MIYKLVCEGLPVSISASVIIAQQTPSFYKLVIDIYPPVGHLYKLKRSYDPIPIPIPIISAGTSSKPLTTFVPIIVRY